MKTKKILVVDDSAFMRKIITEQINRIPGFEVVATAHDGEACLYKIERFKPDAITLDVEMPGLSGLETLKRIKETWDTPVFMLSSAQGKDITIEALEAGAIDFIEKPKNLREHPEVFQKELADHLKAVFRKKDPLFFPSKSYSQSNNPKELLSSKKEAIIIGASTGGPKALLKIIESLPECLSLPVFIVQHMPEGFTSSFARRLDKHAKRPVVEARDGEKIKRGTVYLAPGDYHMVINGETIQLNKEKKVNRVRPAVDVLFESAARAYRSKVLAIILTGMGKDGTYGMKKVKEAGGQTIAQDEASCVVYGMPGNAVSAGVVDLSTGLESIGRILNEVAKVSK